MKPGQLSLNGLGEPRLITLPSPSGRPCHCTELDDRVFASPEDWATALGWPDVELPHFRKLLHKVAKENPTWAATQDGAPVYRWHAVDAALLSFERAYLRHGFSTKDTFTRVALARVYENSKVRRNLNRDLQENAISNATQSAMTLGSDVNELLAVTMQMILAADLCSPGGDE